MHPKNPFKSDYNFDKLVKIYEPLSNHVFINKYGNQTIKFSNQEAVKALNTALLKLHYAIDWKLPKGFLCPPIPSRLDYLLHVNDFIGRKRVRMLDIGTGANLIYPILATQHLGWKTSATEIEDKALNNAQQIIQHNASLHLIQLRKQESRADIFNGVIAEDDNFDVVVCNPPFFSSQKEANFQNSRKVKNLKLKEKETHNFGGTSNELWYPGGEKAFLAKMANESRYYRKQIRWFTALVSKKENLRAIKKSIVAQDPKHFDIVEMEIGNKQSRFVAWSYR